MTPRERLLNTIAHKEPDRVPCAPWNNAQFPSKVQRIPLEIYDGAAGIREYMWFWKQQLNTDLQFSFDSVILSPNCLGGGQYIPYISHSNLKITKEIYEKTGENGLVKITLDTKEGKLSEKRGYTYDNSDYCIEHLFKDVEEDFKKIKYIFPEINEINVGWHLDAQKELGEQGLLMPGFDTPWTFWILKRGIDGFTDPYDFPEKMDEFTEWYTDYVIRYIKLFDRFNPDIFWVHGVNDSFAGPQFLEKYVYKFIKDIRRSTKTYFKHFISGNVSRFLEKEAEAGVDILETLEPPPISDVDLKDAKKRIGDKVVLSGNLDPINILEKRTPKQIREEVKRCLDAAAEGGGYIFSTADQITHLTPIENVIAMVDAVKEFGNYR